MYKLIKETWAEVFFLLALSGGFWLMLEPPLDVPRGVLSGFVGVVAVAVALGVRGVLKNYGGHSTMRLVIKIIAFVFLLAAIITFIIHIVDRSHYILSYKTTNITVEVVIGSEYQPKVKKIQQNEEFLKSDIDLLKASGGPDKPELIWTPESILAAEKRLAIGYLLSLLFTLFSTMFFVEILRFGKPQN